MVVAVLPPDVVHHLAPPGVAEVHVYIGHGHTLRVQETLKVQVVFHGVDVGDVQAVGHHRPGGATAPRPDRNIHALGVAHKVRHDEEIVRKAHLLDHVQLIVQLLAVFRLRIAVPPREALLAQLPQIRGRVIPIRQLESRQVVLTEGEFHPAAVSDALGVGHRVGIGGEQPLHLLRGAEIEIPRLIPHTVLIVHRLARLDAQQHVVALRVLFPQIVGIVGTHQRDARLAVQPQKTPVHLGLLGDAVILQFQIEVLFTEDVPHGQGVLLRPGVVAVQQPLGDLAGQTGGQRDQSLGVFPQQVQVDAGLDIKALDVCLTDHIGQVAVACLVFAQQHQMAGLRVKLVLLVKSGAAGHIHLAADNGMDALLLTGAVEVHRAVHDAVVSDGAGVLPHGLHQCRQVADTARAIQQAVFRMDVEVNKGHGVTLSFFRFPSSHRVSRRRWRSAGRSGRRRPRTGPAPWAASPCGTTAPGNSGIESAP